MRIAIIGAGHVGGALAQRFVQVGHTVLIGAQFPLSDKSINLANQIGHDRFMSIPMAVQQSEVVVLATPAAKTLEVVNELGDTSGKVIIDAMNTGRGAGLTGFSTTTEAILAHTATTDVVKCFNTTGYENMLNPVYGEQGIDMFMAGNSDAAKATARQLAIDIGFTDCYDLGGTDAIGLLEQLAMCWIKLAMGSGYGRAIGFKIVRR
ncbi:NADPH-dependent F420 reductase [Spirosoma sordidisoli]|uniref:NADPH-dependent F420 reductase n=1 Tax=Spirosoma sordidisoli TaxID=2502893 RepID=A0A4Q2UM18_9BACT|nr:NAD(P)-binding domain-containing protein [Spirosoma sordidisoli]RYC70296.1 NADPH-dependent F420 reductase [Spirosoma sordidisoli]